MQEKTAANTTVCMIEQKYSFAVVQLFYFMRALEKQNLTNEEKMNWTSYLSAYFRFWIEIKTPPKRGVNAFERAQTKAPRSLPPLRRPAVPAPSFSARPFLLP